MKEPQLVSPFNLARSGLVGYATAVPITRVGRRWLTVGVCCSLGVLMGGAFFVKGGPDGFPPELEFLRRLGGTAHEKDLLGGPHNAVFPSWRVTLQAEPAGLRELLRQQLTRNEAWKLVRKDRSGIGFARGVPNGIEVELYSEGTGQPCMIEIFDFTQQRSRLRFEAENWLIRLHLAPP